MFKGNLVNPIDSHRELQLDLLLPFISSIKCLKMETDVSFNNEIQIENSEKSANILVKPKLNCGLNSKELPDCRQEEKKNFDGGQICRLIGRRVAMIPAGKQRGEQTLIGRS